MPPRQKTGKRAKSGSDLLDPGSAAQLGESARLSPNGHSQKPVLVPQPNGRGALLSGGLPGNRGGPGRPPSEVRKLARKLSSEYFVEALPKVHDIAQGRFTTIIRQECPSCGYEPPEGVETLPVEIKPGEAVRAADVLGKYGPGSQEEQVFTVEIQTEDDAFDLYALIEGAANETMPSATAARFLASLKRRLAEREAEKRMQSDRSVA